MQPADEVALGDEGWASPPADDPASGTPGEFWASFAARYYAREPCEADKPAADLAVTPAELFRLLIGAVASRGRRPQDPELRVHVGQRQVIADTDEYLPRPDDASLDGYMARMEKELNGEPYLLTVERAHVASRQIWKTAARFLASLYEATGALPGGVDVEVFVGRYPNTIPGIHRERSGVFVSMVQGSKDILVWPPDAPGLPVGTARYQQSIETARRLRCQPGRLVYWPAMHWHVGESPAQSTAGLHIAVLAEPPTIQDLLAGTRGDLDAEIAPGVSPGWSGFGPHELGLPSTFESSVQSVISTYGDSAVVRDKLIAAWLRRRTGLGFTALPPTRNVALRADQHGHAGWRLSDRSGQQGFGYVLARRGRPGRLPWIKLQPRQAGRLAELGRNDLRSGGGRSRGGPARARRADEGARLARQLAVGGTHARRSGASCLGAAHGFYLARRGSRRL